MSPRSKKQFDELREASQKKIFDASLDLFAKTGYQNTSIAHIAKKAGISKGLVYNYFESKEDLLKALVLRLMEEGEKAIQPLDSQDPRKVIENLIRSTFDWLRNNEKLSHLVFSLVLQIDRFDFIHEMAVKKMREYRILLEGLLKAIDYPDYETEARILTAVFDGIGLQFAVMRTDYPLDDMEARLIKKYCSLNNQIH